MSAKSISLYCTEGSSDKEYHVDLAPKDGGWVVNFRYGARGKALKPGTKTEAPLDLAKAQKVYDKLVAEKMAKGYTPDESGVAYTDTPNADRVSGWRPALLKPIDERELDALLAAPEWVASQKYDGERRAVQVSAPGVLQGINRKGLYVGIPQTWAEILGRLPEGTIVDGEHVGDELFIFDCPQIGQRDLREIGYEARMSNIRSALSGIVDRLMRGGIEPKYLKAISVVYATSDPAAKRALLAAIEKKGGEGLVLRHAEGAYVAGVYANSVKYKFAESSTCIVRQVNGSKRSVALVLLNDAGQEVDVGNVTIPANHETPAAGDLAEVRYMHMFEGGSLYQPVYLGKRGDLDRADCKLSQVTRIKAKGSGEESAVEMADDSDDQDVNQPHERMRA